MKRKQITIDLRKYDKKDFSNTYNIAAEILRENPDMIRRYNQYVTESNADNPPAALTTLQAEIDSHIRIEQKKNNGKPLGIKALREATVSAVQTNAFTAPGERARENFIEGLRKFSGPGKNKEVTAAHQLTRVLRDKGGHFEALDLSQAKMEYDGNQTTMKYTDGRGIDWRITLHRENSTNGTSIEYWVDITGSDGTYWRSNTYTG